MTNHQRIFVWGTVYFLVKFIGYIPVPEIKGETEREREMVEDCCIVVVVTVYSAFDKSRLSILT